MSVKDDANRLYSEMSDAYQSALSRGIDRMHPTEMGEIGTMINQAAKLWGKAADHVILQHVQSIHKVVMPKLAAFEKQKEIQYPTSLPPPPREVYTFPTGSGDVQIDPSAPAPSGPAGVPYNGAGGKPGGEQPWYLTGGIDWRIIGGVAGGLLLFTLFLRRRGK